MNLYQMFQQSGPLGWPLLICSILALGVALERTVFLLWKSCSYEGFVGRLQQMLDRGTDETLLWLDGHRSPLARVAAVYLRNERRPDRLREEIVAREASMQLTVLERRLHWLSVIGSLSPMMGLLGTVLGLVQAFQQIERLAGQVQPGDLAAGIWTALMTTVFGLTIAIPTLAVYHFLEQRVAAIQLQMQWLTTTLDERFGHEPIADQDEQPADDKPKTDEEVIVVSAT